jgi:putative SOS response-associated peptidase YedK
MCFSMKIQSNLKILASRFNANIDQLEFDKVHNLINKNSFELNMWNDESRIFPNSIAPVICFDENKKRNNIIPMRYRVRPNGSETEVPKKYNLYNARLDSLKSRKTWNSLLGKKHALVPFTHFYEWTAPPNGKKQLAEFFPENRDLMWAPALYDYYQVNAKEGFYSFALITDDPPQEIIDAHHDRAPIFLQETKISNWLNLENTSSDDYIELLKKTENVHYLNRPFELVKKKSPQLSLFEE